MYYNVKITEVFTRYIMVEAESTIEAEDKAQDIFWNDHGFDYIGDYSEIFTEVVSINDEEGN